MGQGSAEQGSKEDRTVPWPGSPLGEQMASLTEVRTLTRVCRHSRPGACLCGLLDVVFDVLGDSWGCSSEYLQRPGLESGVPKLPPPHEYTL